MSPLPWVPVLYQGPWHPSLVSEYVDGDSVMAGYRKASHIREGVVVRAVNDNWVVKPDPTYPNRKQVKYVSSVYLEKTKD
jgi:hypothetical protein